MPKTLAACLFTSLLAACTTPAPGNDGASFPPPPPALPTPATSSVSGVVEIDAAIPDAVVYLDENGDNLPSAGEPSTTTDASGHYTFTLPAYEGQWAPTVGAIVTSGDMQVHLRAPLAVTANPLDQHAVISPLTTLVASEMLWNQTLGEPDAQAQLVGLLRASNMPFSSAPLDLMGDYVATYTTSNDSAQLRYLATALAGVMSDAIRAGNAAQSHIDCNENLVFTPAVAAMDDQLTGIANAVYEFETLAPDARAAIAANPGGYQDYFINASDLAATIEAELEAEAEDLAAELFHEIQAELVAQLEADVVRIVAGELIAELLG